MRREEEGELVLSAITVTQRMKLMKIFTELRLLISGLLTKLLSV